ncbi:FAD linked oxidase, domain-containing protein [Cladophialophora immunda]|nr:FAD linked oxidase, domain-containing protein [Cladophialophora immunda]
MSWPSSATALPPQYPATYSGIPERLLHKAIREKSRLWKNQTKEDQTPRERGLAIPAGIGRSEFLKALDELTTTLGKEHVVLNDQPLEDGWYLEQPNTHDSYMIMDAEETVSSACVYPGSVEEVQLVVKWANQHLVPLYPISMGRNLGYGGAAPRVRGSVIVDLGRRMNKILDIDPDDCTCLVEPGVSFYALYEEIKKRGYTIWLYAIRRSLVDSFGPGSRSSHKRPAQNWHGGSPWQQHLADVPLWIWTDIRRDIFPVELWDCHKDGRCLMPDPGGCESFMYTFQREDDLLPLIDIVRPLRIANLLENVAQIRHSTIELAVSGLPRSHYYKGTGPIPEEVLQSHLEATPLGRCSWIYYGTSYGPEIIRKYKLDIVHREFTKIPGARRIDPQTLPKDHYFWSRAKIAGGEPDFEELSYMNWVTNGGHLGFSPVSPTRGPDALKLWKIAKTRHDEHGVDLFIAFCVGLRELHMINLIVYDRGSPERRKAVEKCMRSMIEDAAKQGYGEYRTHLLFQDQVARTYNWNDNALMKFNEKLKDALDPNGILAPGRCGIWPERYRDRGWEIGKEGRETSEGGVRPAGASVKL